MITEDSKLFLILFDNYDFLEVPIKDYNYSEDIFRFQADLFYRTIYIYKGNQLNVFITNRKYELIDYYEEKWVSNEERTAGTISKYIFPFELEVNSGDSMYVDFYFSDYSFLAIYLNIVLMLVTMFLLYKKKIIFTKGIMDCLIVLCSGIFGFIAVNIFRYED